MAKETKLKEGSVVWIPCEVKQGMFPTERHVLIRLGGKEGKDGIIIKGFIPSEDVKEQPRGSVRAVIAGLFDDCARLLFRGEIFPTSNPVTVPSKLLAEAAQGVD